MPANAENTGSEPSFGEALENYLADLSARNLKVGPAERLRIEVLAVKLLARGRINSLDDFKPYLAAILRHSPEQAPLFTPMVDARSDQTSVHDNEAIEPVPEQEHAGLVQWLRDFLARYWHGVALSLAAAFVAFAVLWAYWDQIFPDPVVSMPIIQPLPTDGRASQTTGSDDRPRAPPETTPYGRVTAIFEAGLQTYGAPTMTELTAWLEIEPNLDATPETLARAIHELTGLPVGQPLDLIGLGQTHSAAAPVIARALDRAKITPDRVQRPDAYELPSDDAEFWRQQISAELGFGDEQAYEKLIDWAAKTERNEVLSEQQARLVSLLNPNALNKQDRSYWSEPEMSVPTWLGVVAAVVPVGLFVIILFWRYASEVGHLRRRTPNSPPNMTEFVSDTLRKALRPGDRDRQLAKVLQTRDRKTFPRLDLERTVSETIRNGGLVTFCEEQIFPTPEYLVLIEEPHPSDHIANAMRELLTPLQYENRVHFDIFSFQKSPSIVFSEAGSGALPIESLLAKYPDHRLIILGTGHGLIASLDGSPSRVVETLRKWERRAILTPTPLSAWSSLEFQIAEALDAPVGRATRSGFQTVGDLLGLEGRPPEPLPNSRGDIRLAELPSILTRQPQKIVFQEDVSESTGQEVISAVEGILDRDAFRWFSALAIFPVLQWDITLYLGLTLPSERDVLASTDDPAKMTPCYSPDAVGDMRLATLASLPWLRVGRMPNWLRSELISRLQPRDKWHVHQTINKALGDPHVAKTPDLLNSHEFRLKIGREPKRDPLKGKAPKDDALLFEFLRRGDAGAYEAPPEIERFFSERYHRPIERFLRRGSNQRLAAVGLAAGTAAWFLAPSGGQPDVTGAWLPLLLIGIGACTALLANRLVKATEALSGFSRLKTSSAILRQRERAE